MIKSAAFHAVFIFLTFAAFAYTIADNPNLDDIRVYSSALENLNKQDLYFEYTFVLFLEVFDFIQFEILYSLSVALSAVLTYCILSKKFKRPDNLQLFLFLLLYTPQFSLAWRQLLATPAFTYIIINFLICYETPKTSKIFEKFFGVLLSSFHKATLVSGSLILAFSRYNKKIALILILFLCIFVVLGGYTQEVYTFIVNKLMVFVYQVNGASAYIDDSQTTFYRMLLVNLKFVLLFCIFYLLYRTQKYATSISVGLLGALCIIKVILSLLIWFLPSPAWGRINGLLVVVDYIVLMHSLKRYPVLSLTYLLPTYILGVTLHPYFR